MKYSMVVDGKEFYKNYFAVIAKDRRSYDDLVSGFDADMTCFVYLDGNLGKGSRYTGLLFAADWRENKLYTREFFKCLLNCVEGGYSGMISYLAKTL